MVEPGFRVQSVGLGIAVYEEKEAFAYYGKHCEKNRPEVKLYIALKRIRLFGGSREFWIRVYESAVKRGVEPRKELVEEYEARMSGDVQ